MRQRYLYTIRKSYKNERENIYGNKTNIKMGYIRSKIYIKKLYKKK